MDRPIAVAVTPRLLAVREELRAFPAESSERLLYDLSAMQIINGRAQTAFSDLTSPSLESTLALLGFATELTQSQQTAVSTSALLQMHYHHARAAINARVLAPYRARVASGGGGNMSPILSQKAEAAIRECISNCFAIQMMVQSAPFDFGRRLTYAHDLVFAVITYSALLLVGSRRPCTMTVRSSMAQLQLRSDPVFAHFTEGVPAVDLASLLATVLRNASHRPNDTASSLAKVVSAAIAWEAFPPTQAPSHYQDASSSWQLVGRQSKQEQEESKLYETVPLDASWPQDLDWLAGEGALWGDWSQFLAEHPTSYDG
jgi:hypothetical protein